MNTTKPTAENSSDAQADTNTTTQTTTTTTEKVHPTDLTAFQQNILAILYDESMYGLAVKRALEDYYGEPISHGRLYPNLDTLRDMGLLEKYEQEIDDRTNLYEITDAGERLVEAAFGWEARQLGVPVGVAAGNGALTNRGVGRGILGIMGGKPLDTEVEGLFQRADVDADEVAADSGRDA